MRSPQTLSEADRRALAAWAADCADHVLAIFEAAALGDRRPRDLIARTRAIARGELDVSEGIRRRFEGSVPAREIQDGAAAAAARAAGQAAAIPHSGAHALGAAGYAAKAAGLAAPDRADARREEVRWQLEHLVRGGESRSAVTAARRREPSRPTRTRTPHLGTPPRDHRRPSGGPGGRRAVRAFRAQPVPKDVLVRVLQAAARAPSSGNLQPWRVFVVAGEPLTELKNLATARALAGDPGDEREYPMYPDGMAGAPYSHRFTAAAIQRYQALGIDRDDPDRPSKVAALNTGAFGAPVVLFCFLDPGMGAGQWADVGMYLQTVMLLLRAENLHSCPQVMWTMYRRTVSEAVGVRGLVLLCGVAIGYEDEAVPRQRTGRANLEETVAFLGL